ncbi:unnamed protein product, partial [Brenthis ino]
MVNLLDISEADAKEIRRKWWQSPKSKKKKTKPASVASAVGGSRGSFLQRDKLYKQRLKQLTKQHPQPFVVRGHHLQLVALTAAAHCHHCARAVGGPAPQACVCALCGLRVHRACARAVDEGCCIDADHAPHNRISRFMERMHTHAPDSSDKKSRKTSGTAHFLNMERSVRKMEDDSPWDAALAPGAAQGKATRCTTLACFRTVSKLRFIFIMF